MPTWTKEVVDLSVAGASLTIDDIKIDGTTIGHTDDTDLLTLASGALTVAGTLTSTGTITGTLATASQPNITSVGGNFAIGGDLTVTGNDINSSSATALTLSGSNVEVKGDLTVTGNDIKASTGATAITLAGADVTIADDLEVGGDLTVTGNRLTFGNSEFIDNDSDGYMDFNTGAGGFRFLGDIETTLSIWPGTNTDAKVVFYDTNSGIPGAKWTLGNDATDDSFSIQAGVGGFPANNALKISSAGASTFYGATQFSNTLTVGVDDTGYDVKFFGDGSDHYMLWDTSNNNLRILTDSIRNSLVLENTDDGANNCPGLALYRNSASAVDSDVLGVVTFWGRSEGTGASSDDDSPHGTNADDVKYARIQSKILDATDGGEEGQLQLGVSANGALVQSAIQIMGQSDGTVDVNIGYGAASLTKVKGYFAANNATPIAAPTYTATTQTARNADTATADAAIQDVLQTLIADLIATGILQSS